MIVGVGIGGRRETTVEQKISNKITLTNVKLSKVI